MNESESATGQVDTSAAEVYEHFFVPALFQQWPPVVLVAARVSAGDAVLDVGCGTGVLARAARAVVGHGHVVGLDCNEGMLAVARRTSGAVNWMSGAAEDIPFEDHTFDRVVSQFAAMFFADRRRAIGEMARVVTTDGCVAVATWASLASSPGYAALVELLRSVIGDDAASALEAPFTLGDEASLLDLMASAFGVVDVGRHLGTACFSGLEEWLHTEIRGWTLANEIDDEQFTRLRAGADHALAAFVQRDGTVRFPVAALIATCARPK